VWNSGQALQQSQASGPGYGHDQGGYGQGGYGQSGYGQPQSGQPYGAPFGGGGGGGSFLGTAAAAAAGAVGGGLLLNSIRGMMGGGSHQSFGDSAGLGGGQRPWSDQSGSSLAKDAGINDVGSSGKSGDDNSNSRAGLFDQASNDDNNDGLDHDSDGFDDDDDNDDGDGDRDYA
jgi:hypothetical protein